MEFQRKRIITKTGNWVKGRYYYRRKDELNNLWDRIEAGEHILLSAPRRVGKTSILMDLRENPRNSYTAIYEITEAVNDQNSFFKRIYESLVKELDQKGRITEAVKRLFSDRGIKSAGLQNIEFESQRANYYEEIISLCKKLEPDQTYLVLIDEYAQTIQNILEDQDLAAAREFLSLNRELRQMPETNGRLQFVYAGSIGLGNVVGNINLTRTINDINPFRMKSYRDFETKALVQQLTEGTGVDFPEQAIDYMIEKLQWVLPFYVQLILEGCDDLLPMESDKPIVITNKMIDQAFNASLDKRNYFEDWFSRLRRSFKGDEYSFIMDVLNNAAVKGEISKAEIVNIADARDLLHDYHRLIDVLENDGYITSDNEGKDYHFTSPLLAAWWKKALT